MVEYLFGKELNLVSLKLLIKLASLSPRHTSPQRFETVMDRVRVVISMMAMSD